MPPILILDTITDIYEVLESCDCFVETRATSNYILRRSAIAPKKLAKLFPEVSQLLTNVGFLIKKDKCSTAPNAIPCFSWCSHHLVDHDLVSTSDKVTRVTVRSTSNPGTVSPSRTNDPNVRDDRG